MQLGVFNFFISIVWIPLPCFTFRTRHFHPSFLQGSFRKQMVTDSHNNDMVVVNLLQCGNSFPSFSWIAASSCCTKVVPSSMKRFENDVICVEFSIMYKADHRHKCTPICCILQEKWTPRKSCRQKGQQPGSRGDISFGELVEDGSSQPSQTAFTDTSIYAF